MTASPGWRGKTLVAAQGGKIGRIVDVLVDGRTGDPEWLAVQTGGRLRSKQRFVPVSRAMSNGADVVVPFPEEQIRNAPAAKPVNGTLTYEDRAILTYHYRLG